MLPAPPASARNVNAWEPVHVPLTSGTSARSRDLLERVVWQLDVEANPRYAARGGATYCNVFVTDCADALGVRLPHWWLGHELSANGLLAWIERQGISAFGWGVVDKVEARALALAGRPVVAGWANPRPVGSGHVALVVPSDDDRTRIAQAGRRCFYGEPVASGFGALPVTCYAHE
ncbi:MAG: hypothetical protein Q8Q14_10750 [Gemmatimonadales bacterium]|nr:hypothetical protein [Gemmatimonadales bacterium]